MKYKGYTIKRVRRQGLNNYQVIHPNGGRWPEIAANMATAKKWINAELAQIRRVTSRFESQIPGFVV